MKLLIAVLSFVAASSASAEIIVENAYARVAHPGAPVGAAFFVIHNDADKADRLIGVKTSVAAMAEIHTHIDAGDGIIQMRPVEGGLEIPGGGEHALVRGGDHIMMMGLSEPLKQGDTVPMTLVFETAGEITLDIVVDNEREQGSNGHSHSGHDN